MKRTLRSQRRRRVKLNALRHNLRGKLGARYWNERNGMYFWPDGTLMRSGEWIFRITHVPEARVVKTTRVKRTTISSVWLGLDHGFYSKVPLIFETMVFGEWAYDQRCWRHSTAAEAIRIHDEVVALAMSGTERLNPRLN